MLARGERVKDAPGNCVVIARCLGLSLCGAIRGVMEMNTAWASVCSIKLYSGGL